MAGTHEADTKKKAETVQHFIFFLSDCGLHDAQRADQSTGAHSAHHVVPRPTK